MSYIQVILVLFVIFKKTKTNRKCYFNQEKVNLSFRSNLKIRPIFMSESAVKCLERRPGGGRKIIFSLNEQSFSLL